MTQVNDYRELDCRTHDGITVCLYWRRSTDTVLLEVEDARSGQAFDTEVPADKAAYAFHHPYVYV